MPRRRRGGATKRARPAEAQQQVVLAAEAEPREEQAAQEEEDEEWGWCDEGGAGELPWEVWVNVLQFVSCGDVARFGLACRLFSAIADIGMVWRTQARRDCWRAMERWGEGVVDPAQVGWRTAYQAYDRLHWARLLAAQSKSLSAGKADKLARSKHRSSFSVEADLSCFAVDEQSFAAPDVVAVGVFGRNATNDCVAIWRKGPPTPSAPKWVTRWDLNDGREGWHLWRGVKGHASTVSCAQFVDGTDRLITGSWDKTIKVWQNVCDEGKQASCSTTLSGHKFEVTCLRRHKSLLVSGSQDKTVALWDLEAGKQVQSFVGHTHFVEDVLFDKEGVRLMSASMDTSVRVWDPRAGPAEIARYVMSAPVRSLALNHEGDCLYFCPNPHDHDWIELRAADRKVARARASFWSPPVRYASKVALSPFRLEANTDFAVFGGSLVSLPPAGESVGTASLMCYDPKRSDVFAFGGRKGVCWTNSQVIVTADTTRIWMADMGGGRGFATDPDADENVQARRRLQPENGAGKAAATHLSASTPTSEEVARDVARIQRQIAEIRRGNLTRRR